MTDRAYTFETKEGVHMFLRTKFYVAPMCQWAEQPTDTKDIVAALLAVPKKQRLAILKQMPEWDDKA